jgi:cell division protein FtsB
MQPSKKSRKALTSVASFVVCGVFEYIIISKVSQNIVDLFQMQKGLFVSVVAVIVILFACIAMNVIYWATDNDKRKIRELNAENRRLVARNEKLLEDEARLKRKDAILNLKEDSLANR